MVSPIPRRLRQLSALAGRVRGMLRRQFITRNRRLSAALAVITVGVGVAAVHVSQSWFAPGVMILPILAGALLLWPRALLVLFGVVAATLTYDAVKGKVGPGIIATIVVTGAFAFVLARTRAKLGLQGLRGDQMLIELRDRLRDQGRLPRLPPGWQTVSVLQPAGGASFGGDFVVSASDGKTLQVALVDVSGKGIDAGTRALLLSGAFGGLIGTVPGGDFLSACNAFLRRGPTGGGPSAQRRAEGFVTAVHLSLDLVTGEYTVDSAGHPPAAHFDAGAGTWHMTEARGIVLGIVADLRSVPAQGVLRPGDALMLYTDGLIEAPGLDIDAGIDRLLGEADRLVTGGFGQGAQALVQSLQAGVRTSDDCALVLIWRK
jgi:Stage II sporulation protein E (SpoIIE)